MLTGWVLLIKASGLDSVDFPKRAILDHFLRSTVRIVIYVHVSINPSQPKHRNPSLCQKTHIVDRKGPGT